MDEKREIWLDWLRVTACFMVMVVHSTEPFYLGGDGSLIQNSTDAFWASFCDCLVRCCVPLFVVASAYLQFPIKYSTGEFFKRRAVRILIPFVFWTVVYALVWGQPVQNFKDLLLNFNYAAGHLWFVYMILGLYLLMPLLSPWAHKVGKKELLFYIAVCAFTSFIPLIRDWAAGGDLAVTYGPAGLPRQALFPLWGEASWNGYGVFYYMSGFIGYMLFGLYLKKFVADLSWKRTLAISIPSFLLGFGIAFGGFLRRVYASCGGDFPAAGGVDKAVWWETTWCNDTIGVVLMTIALVLLFRKIKADGGFYRRIVLPVSKASYGMYLCHMLVLLYVSGYVREWLCPDSLGFWTTPVAIFLSAIASFILVAVAAVLLQRIPKAGKWLIG